MHVEVAALVEILAGIEPAAAADPGAVRVVRAPGRVNLIGEYTDLHLGHVLPVAIDLEIRIAWLPTDDGRVELTRLDDGTRDGFDLDAPRPRSGSWVDYVAGTAWSLAATGAPLRGLRGVIASDLPAAAGLSSSAAIETAAAWALLDDVATQVDPLTLARLCQRAENDYVGVPCGLMDQFASACGVAGAALLLDCRSLDWRPVALPADVALVVLHTGAPRRVDDTAYETRRQECEAALAAVARDDPDVTSLRDVSAFGLSAARSRMDPVAFQRAEHVLTENQRVLETVAALEAGDLAAVAAAFAASHASLRDRFEVVSPELDAMVGIATAVPGVIAARMTGAGFGGCTVNLVRPEAVESLRGAVLREYPARTGLTPTVLPVSAAAGAGRLR